MNLLTLPKDNLIRTYTSQGMNYIKNSKGKTSNAMLSTHCTIDISNNSIAMLVYIVKFFESNQEDYFYQNFQHYTEALDMYNELLIKWNGNRIIN